MRILLILIFIIIRLKWFDKLVFHSRYIVFATEFNGALSAKYDDLFGAAEEFTDAAEREILTALGKRRNQLKHQSTS